MSVKPFEIKIIFGQSDEESEYSFATESERDAFELGVDFGVDQFPDYTEYTDEDLEEFKTPDEKKAFGLGVGDADGWSLYQVVEDKTKT
jgi:hypothetical protein